MKIGAIQNNMMYNRKQVNFGRVSPETIAKAERALERVKAEYAETAEHFKQVSACDPKELFADTQRLAEYHYDMNHMGRLYDQQRELEEGLRRAKGESNPNSEWSKWACGE